MLSAAASCCSLGQPEAALVTPDTHDTAAVVAVLDAQAMLSQNLVEYM